MTDDDMDQGTLFDAPESVEPDEGSPEPDADPLEEDDIVSESNEEQTEKIEPANFQEALDRLQEAARELESGELPLEEAMERYREGQQLIEFCEDRLEEAELLVEEIDDTGASPTVEEKEEPSE